MADVAGCEIHLGDIGSPACGKPATCQIEGVFACPGCRIVVLSKYPDSQVVEETAPDWGSRVKRRRDWIDFVENRELMLPSQLRQKHEQEL